MTKPTKGILAYRIVKAKEAMDEARTSDPHTAKEYRSVAKILDDNHRVIITAEQEWQKHYGKVPSLTTIQKAYNDAVRDLTRVSKHP